MGEVDTSPSVGLVQHMIECGRAPDTMNQRVWPNWQVADALEAHAERAIESLTAERDRLKAALDRSAEHCPQCDGAGEYDFGPSRNRTKVPCEFCEIARAALATQEQPND